MYTGRRISAWSKVFMLLALLTGSCKPVLGVPSTTLSNQAGLTSLKLLVDQSGIYRLTGREIRKAELAYSRPEQLQLSLAGKQVPVWIDGRGDDFGLVFYGAAADSFYTRQNVYWLSAGAGDGLASSMPAQETDAPGGQVSAGYRTQATFEKNLLFSPLVAGDPWYWMALPAPTQASFDVDLENIAFEEADIRLTLWGSTQAPTEYDHHLRLLVNDTLVLDERWDGQGARELTGAIPAGVLKTGQNKILLDAPGDSGAVADNVFLQRFTITYSTQGIRAGDQVLVTGQGKGVTLSLPGGNLQAFDLTQPDRPARLVGLVQSAEGAKFLAEKDHLYRVLDDQGYLHPGLESPAAQPDLRQLAPGAEYLAIGPADLLEPVQPLLALKQEQGFSTLSISLAAVYDQFLDGRAEPGAIQQLMLYAQANWEVKPKYLLLVGDASYDPQGYLTAPEANRLPVFFITTEYGGLTGSDLPFARADGDNKPDLAVGRVPARTPEEVRVWVAKTLAYERTPAAAWQSRALAVADGQESSFKLDAQRFLDRLDGRYQGELYAPDAGAQDGAGQIQDYFDEGYGLVSYFGHGSVNMWGRDKLLTNDDIQAFKNQRLPVVITMTCLNGFFIHPTHTSLAEALLFNPVGGAVAVLAPTSLTLALDQVALGDNLYAGFAASGERRLGDILLAAQRLMPQDTQGQRDVLYTFMLFGDPALKIY